MDRDKQNQQSFRNRAAGFFRPNPGAGAAQGLSSFPVKDAHVGLEPATVTDLPTMYTKPTSTVHEKVVSVPDDATKTKDTIPLVRPTTGTHASTAEPSGIAIKGPVTPVKETAVVTETRPAAALITQPEAAQQVKSTSTSSHAPSLPTAPKPSATETASKATKSATETASGVTQAASSTAAKAGDYASVTAQKATDTASGAAQKATGAASATAQKTTETASSTAQKAGETASGAAQKATGVASKVTETATDTATKGAELASKTASSAASTTAGAAKTGAKAASGAAEAATDVAGRAAQTAGSAATAAAKGAAGAAQGATELAGKAAEKTGEVAGQAVESAKDVAEWTGEQVVESVDTIHSMTVRLVTFLWNVTTFIPFWLARATWNASAFVYRVLRDHFATTVSWFADKGADLINSFSNLMYSVLLGRLRGVNEHIDRIIEHTPLMVRDALYKARVEKLEKDKYPGLIPPPPEETSAGPEPTTASELTKADTEKDTHTDTAATTKADVHSVKGATTHTEEETDLARAANEALHRLFDTTNADNRETLLAEARKLAWHLWMVVSLQVTAVRSVLMVTEGLLGWALSAWWQMATAGVILAVMLGAAPIAATATALAWTVRLLAGQALWIVQLVDHVRALVVPSLHSGLMSLQDWVSPYLATKETTTTTTGTDTEVKKPGLFEQYLTDARNLARTWLDTSINFTAELLPEADSSSSDEDEAIKEFEATEATPTDTTPTDTTPTAPVSAHPKRRKAEGLLSAACQEAQDATHKAFALADASARTVVDVVRVLLLGMATRFDLPMLKWVPKMYKSGGFAQKDPDIHKFLEVAGASATPGHQGCRAMSPRV